MRWIDWAAIAGGAGLVLVLGFGLAIWARPAGGDLLRQLGQLVYRGALRFFGRSYALIGLSSALLAVGLALGPGLYPAAGFGAGVLLALLTGWVGLRAATLANLRTTHAADKFGEARALDVAFLGGATMGLFVLGLALGGLSLVFMLPLDEARLGVLYSLALGAAWVALCARVGGGIYAKIADLGADLAGKVEAGIPEDDPRNPATMADNTGDAINEVAGLCIHRFAATVLSVVGAVAVGWTQTKPAFLRHHELWGMYPILLLVGGLAASVVGIVGIKLWRKTSPQALLRWMTYLVVVLFLGAAFAIGHWLTRSIGPGELTAVGIRGALGLFWAVLSGVVAGILIGGFHEFHTTARPMRQVARASEVGPGINVLAGLSEGMRALLMPIVVLSGSLWVAHHFADLFGIAVSAVGMLATLTMTLSVEGFAPVADSASGMAEMVGLGPEARKIADELKAVGGATASIGKGFAMGSSMLIALCLLALFYHAAGRANGVATLTLDPADPRVVAGFLLGGVLPFFFSAYVLRAVGQSIWRVVQEIRRQFKEVPGLLEGKVRPDSSCCMAIATTAALRGMIAPALLTVLAPFAVGSLAGFEALAGFLAGAVLTGVILGQFMQTTGHAWNRAKKWIELGNLGGKGSAAHQAALVGDMVGDPFKNSSGPSLQIVIQLMPLVSLVTAPWMTAIHSWLQTL